MGRMEPDTAAQAMETMPQREENLSKQCIDDVDEMSMECQCFQLKSIYFQFGIICLRLFVLLNLKERISMELHLLSIHENLLSNDCPFEPQKKGFELNSIYFQFMIIYFQMIVLVNPIETHLLSLHYTLLSIDCPFEPQKKGFQLKSMCTQVIMMYF